MQIAAAALWLKAQLAAPSAEIKQLNLVASNLGISRLADNDPSLVELRRVIEAETGIPGKLTMQVVEALRGADHLGSLLKIDQAIEGAIDSLESSPQFSPQVTQILLFPDGTQVHRSGPIDRGATQAGILSALETFLSRHTSSEELGLRLAGEQLAAGVRFVRLVKEGAYDLVVANPPYQGTSKMADAKYVAAHYKLAKADLFAAFLLRGMELVHSHATIAMVTMRNWMFIKQYSELRHALLQNYDLRALGDLDKGAFEYMETSQLISVCLAVFRKCTQHLSNTVAIQPTALGEKYWSRDRTYLKRAAVLVQRGKYSFDTAAMSPVPEWPLVYWWDSGFLRRYLGYPLLGDAAPVRAGMQTSNNERYLRRPWETGAEISPCFGVEPPSSASWVPYIKGAAGIAWVEPLEWMVRWKHHGLEKQVMYDAFGSNGGGNGTPSRHLYFRRGIAFSMIGTEFQCRVHRYPSIIGNKGSSVFPLSDSQLCDLVCLMNSQMARYIMSSLNPGTGFEVGDVNRLPLLPLPNSDRVFSTIESSHALHAKHREVDKEFRSAGPSPWRHAQEWAQLAVDRPEGAPLPEYIEQLDPEPPTDHLSVALGVALGRFGANGEGILDPTKNDLSHALPAGILFLDGALGDDDIRDSLGHPAAQIIHDKWSEYGPQIDRRRSLRDWLREKFFADVHKGMYENRPIHWPLSSAKKTFVAWVTIHRWTDQTLRVLLADHLEPALKRLDGEITDLTAARNSADRRQARNADDRYADVKAWRDELAEFIHHVQECAERGPLPPDPKKPEREVDARFIPDLDDGVMINSAALWPLLEPQWKDPKKWWKELVAAQGKKDYDWSHLALRYWPTRVDAKCQQDPSLSVAHGCFWKYHPARAWAWELRLQDEIGPDFRIEEISYRGDGGDTAHRTNYLRDHPTETLDAIEKEVLRRKRKQRKPQPELTILEPGLWSAAPDECWALELKLTDRQQVEFRLLAPDESESRAQFEKAHPDKVKTRKERLSNLRPPDLFPDQDDDGETESDDAEDLDTEDADTEEVEA